MKQLHTQENGNNLNIARVYSFFTTEATMNSPTKPVFKSENQVVFNSFSKAFPKPQNCDECLDTKASLQISGSEQTKLRVDVVIKGPNGTQLVDLSHFCDYLTESICKADKVETSFMDRLIQIEELSDASMEGAELYDPEIGSKFFTDAPFIPRPLYCFALPPPTFRLCIRTCVEMAIDQDEEFSKGEEEILSKASHDSPRHLALPPLPILTEAPPSSSRP